MHIIPLYASLADPLFYTHVESIRCSFSYISALMKVEHKEFFDFSKNKIIADKSVIKITGF